MTPQAVAGGAPLRQMRQMYECPLRCIRSHRLAKRQSVQKRTCVLRHEWGKPLLVLLLVLLVLLLLLQLLVLLLQLLVLLLLLLLLLLHRCAGAPVPAACACQYT
jgi:hypothetical protein